MAARMISKFAILAIAVCVLLQNTDAEKIHVVGGDLGWTVPPGGPIVYDTWASLQDFDVGDILCKSFEFSFCNSILMLEHAYLIHVHIRLRMCV